MEIQFNSARIGLLMCALGCLSFGASASVVLDLTGEGTQGNPGHGNSLQFSQSGIAVEVTGFGATGINPTRYNGQFETAEVTSWGTGIGVCNRHELTSSSSCRSSEHEVDAFGSDDLVVFQFDQLVFFENITIDPYDGGPNGRDIRFWVGDSATLGLPPVFTNEYFDTLDGIFGASTLSNASPSYNPFTHALSGLGDILVVSGDYTMACGGIHDPNPCDAFKIKNVGVSPIPLPGAVWLFGSAVLGLFAARKRSS